MQSNFPKFDGPPAFDLGMNLEVKGKRCRLLLYAVRFTVTSSTFPDVSQKRNQDTDFICSISSHVPTRTPRASFQRGDSFNVIQWIKESTTCT